MMNYVRFLPVVLGVAVAAVLAVPGAAQAHVRFGFGIGVPPIYAYPPPVIYYPAPAYYPAPVYYAPPVATPAPAGFTCYAGRYICPLNVVHPINGPCTCPTRNGTATGVVR